MEQWKEDLINAKEKLIYVNYKRGEGVTTIILHKILKANKNIKVLYIGCLNRRLLEKICESLPYNCDITYKNNYTKIEKHGEYGDVIIELTRQLYVSPSNKGVRYDIGISDCVYTIVPEIMCNQCEQVIMVMPDLKDLKIINSNKFLSNQKSELSFEEQIKLQKIKLLKELDEIPCNQNTTITREKIVGMLKKLNDMELGE